MSISANAGIISFTPQIGKGVLPVTPKWYRHRATMVDLAVTDEVAEGQAVKVETQGLVLAVFQVEGDFYVTDDTCTHGPGSLSEGCILGDMVECNFHNGAFNIRTGEVMEPPCMTPLKTYPVSVRDKQIFIKPV